MTSAAVAHAAPESHLLRIDPRDGLAAGRPLLTTVVAIQQTNATSEVLRPCVTRSGASALVCWDERTSTPGAFGAFFPFPTTAVRFVARVDDEDRALRFVDAVRWSDAQSQPRVGTAWILAIDDSAAMTARATHVREAAYSFLRVAGPNDLVDVVTFDDLGVVRDTGWKARDRLNDLVAVLQSRRLSPRQRKGSRAFLPIVKSIVDRAFAGLLAREDPGSAPMHQAMVLFSNGAGSADAADGAPGAEVLRSYFTKGRFYAEGTPLPKTPLPVVSIWFPSKAPSDPFKDRDAQVMSALANPEIGGFFGVAPPNPTGPSGAAIGGLVRQRFDAMWVARFAMPCVNPTVEQSLTLAFEGVTPAIVPDGTFKDVAMGVPPGDWPLDVDLDATAGPARAKPIAPGELVTVRGEFCWGGDAKRVESYFFASTGAPSLSEIRAQDVRGEIVDVGPNAVTIRVPAGARALVGGDGGPVRLALYDVKTHRASALGVGAIALPMRAAEPEIVGDAAVVPVTVVHAPVAPPASRGCACETTNVASRDLAAALGALALVVGGLARRAFGRRGPLSDLRQ